jgi:RNA recognition motif-containing protein
MNIYIGNLSYKARETDLKAVFEKYGKVDSIEIIVDRRTRRSRGYAFVEMSNDQAAEEAIKALDGKEFLGRSLRVDASQPKEGRPRSGAPRTRAAGGRASPAPLSDKKKTEEEKEGGVLGFFKKLFK